MCVCVCVHLKEEETFPSLAHKVLSAKNTKKLMSVDSVDELARSAMPYILAS